VSFFVQRLKTETKSRSATGRSIRRPPTPNDNIPILFYLQADHKKKSAMNSCI
jgi:hypothetical protein